ncbi:MAG: YmaF family [Clostridia bacterium]|jgi:hypothetical protein|nr:YmaF family [Clostridia bacterium]MDN5321971.1 YmaF family [Clostridia bacterium]
MNTIPWPWYNTHVHFYSNRTTVNDNHSHSMRGVTFPAVGGFDNHVHL